MDGFAACQAHPVRHQLRSTLSLFARPFIFCGTISFAAYTFTHLHIRLLFLEVDAAYKNTDYTKFKIKQNTQIALRVNKIITKIFTIGKLRKAYKTKDLLNLSVRARGIKYCDGFLILDNILSSCFSRNIGPDKQWLSGGVVLGRGQRACILYRSNH